MITGGVIESINGAVRIQYPAFIASFKNQIITEHSMLSGGDSGSACLELTGMGDPQNLVGLCFAGSVIQSIICPIAPMMTKWDFKFTIIVGLEGVVRKDGRSVAGATVLAFNLSTMEFIGKTTSDASGHFDFGNCVYQFETVVIFAQYTLGITEFGGFHRILCVQTINYSIVNISEYTPIPDGVFCRFKLWSADFLETNIVPDQYFSNLY